MKKLKYMTSNTVIIPIGTYHNIYPNDVKKNEARKILKIKSKDFVFGFFGRIEKYKGVCQLIDDFNSIDDVDTKLVIAGQCLDEELESFLKISANNNKNILLHIGFIDNKDVQIYINSCDVFAYPFVRITTSSSVILNMSFGIPTIANAIGDIIDLPTKTGFYREPGNLTTSFKDLMISAMLNREYLPEMGTQAERFVKQNSWKNSAIITQNTYKHLFASSSPDGVTR
jgi:glycosyltransferase involved in cell wall biosynthesis